MLSNVAINRLYQRATQEAIVEINACAAAHCIIVADVRYHIS
jgi:hypothetical protein